MATMQLHWDIFCRVIDNYGDIGVCWRLARQLRAEYGQIVRLWVDDLSPLTLLRPGLDSSLPAQVVDGVDIRQWLEPFPVVTSAEVVIEAFACELPDSYLQAMAARSRKTCWINLEYLSAEDWVEGCHGLASPHPTLPLTKYFYFPGFTPRTGGLLRETDLLNVRDAFISSLSDSRDFVEVSLFCYDTAPIGPLLDTWISGTQPVLCHVPPGRPLAAVQRHLRSGTTLSMGNLRLEPIPFLPQEEFDQLLWRCAINFVRGEDSFIRAQWAGKPFVWHVYRQEDDAHLAKLEAFLNRYVEDLSPVAALSVKSMARAWNGDGEDLPAAWTAFIAQRDVLMRHGKTWTNRLAAQGNLAGNLIKFCADRL